MIDGVEVELFTSGGLCKVMERQQRALYGWERDFDFPQALWRVRDMKTVNRWYSKKQIIAIHTIMKHFNFLRGKQRNKLAKMIEAVRDCFYRVDQPLVQRKKEPA